MEASIVTFVILVVLGSVLGLVSYGRLLDRLRKHHSKLYLELGEPKLFMASPTTSLRLQRFIYSPRALATGDEELSATVRFLRWFTALLVLGVVITSVAMIIASTMTYRM